MSDDHDGSHAADDGARVGEAATAPPGYQINGVLGTGGFSTVYRARQHQFDRDVALKILNIELGDPRAAKRFANECLAMGRLDSHPYIADVYAAGTTPLGQPYIAMRLYGRGSLADLVAASGPMSLADVRDFGIKVAKALTAAHERGIIHRDVKPQNILLSDYGEPALSDFGVSILEQQAQTHAPTQAFTYNHVAPEILESEQYGPASDQYALASTLYTLATGNAPFRSTTVARQILAILNNPPPDMADPRLAPIAPILARGLAKRPTDRYPDMAAFAAALQAVGAGDIGQASERPGAAGGPQSVGVAAGTGPNADQSETVAPDHPAPSGSPLPPASGESTVLRGRATPDAATVAAAGAAGPGFGGTVQDAGAAASGASATREVAGSQDPGGDDPTNLRGPSVHGRAEAGPGYSRTAAQAVSSTTARRRGGKRPLVIIGGVVAALVVALAVGLIVRAASSGQKAEAAPAGQKAGTESAGQKAGTESASCKAGVSCAIGDIGPGGGVVFFAAATRQRWGQYLEAAPSGWRGGLEDPEIKWCDKTDESLPGTFGTAIGTGLDNTNLMVVGCSSGAGLRASEYLGGGKDDWFLPSKDELNAMLRQQANVGGLVPDLYWSSSEGAPVLAWSQVFDDSGQLDDKDFAFRVRPVRAF